MTESVLQKKRTTPFRYGVGMFGTSIPINMFKSFAAIFSLFLKFEEKKEAKEELPAA